jgi:hypothetical protein
MYVVRSDGDSAELPNLPHEQQIFHERNFGKSPQAMKRVTAQKDSLIAIRHSQPTHTQVAASFNRPIQETIRVNAHPETAGNAAGLIQSATDSLLPSGGQPAIGMQE